MFKNLSIYRKMNYLILMATISVVGATVFVFAFMTHLNNSYDHLYKNSMASGLDTLSIEKNLNYISRTTRDIMLGGDYNKNIAKLNDKIKSIEESFLSLEKINADDSSLSTITKAKTSTMDFLNSSLSMMKSLTKDDIQNRTSEVY